MIQGVLTMVDFSLGILFSGFNLNMPSSESSLPSMAASAAISVSLVSGSADGGLARPMLLFGLGAASAYLLNKLRHALPRLPEKGVATSAEDIRKLATHLSGPSPTTPIRSNMSTPTASPAMVGGQMDDESSRMFAAAERLLTEMSSDSSGSTQDPNKIKELNNLVIAIRAKHGDAGLARLEQLSSQHSEAVSRWIFAHAVRCSRNVVYDPITGLPSTTQMTAHESKLATALGNTMRKAFWDKYKQDLKQNPTNTALITDRVAELVESLCRFISPDDSKKRRPGAITRAYIKQKIDVELLKQEVEKKAFDSQSFLTFVRNVVEILAELEAPAEHEKTVAWHQSFLSELGSSSGGRSNALNADILVDVLAFFFSKCDQIEADLKSFHTNIRSQKDKAQAELDAFMAAVVQKSVSKVNLRSYLRHRTLPDGTKQNLNRDIQAARSAPATWAGDSVIHNAFSLPETVLEAFMKNKSFVDAAEAMAQYLKMDLIETLRPETTNLVRITCLLIYAPFELALASILVSLKNPILRDFLSAGGAHGEDSKDSDVSPNLGKSYNLSQFTHLKNLVLDKPKYASQEQWTGLFDKIREAALLHIEKSLTQAPSQDATSQLVQIMSETTVAIVRTGVAVSASGAPGSQTLSSSLDSVVSLEKSVALTLDPNSQVFRIWSSRVQKGYESLYSSARRLLTTPQGGVSTPADARTPNSRAVSPSPVATPVSAAGSSTNRSSDQTGGATSESALLLEWPHLFENLNSVVIQSFFWLLQVLSGHFEVYHRLYAAELKSMLVESSPQFQDTLSERSFVSQSE